MERVCFLLQVRQKRLEEYKERHQKVWPDMLRALHQCGWRNYSLFLREDGLLIGYFETDDFQSARNSLAHEEINTAWQSEMAPFFTGLNSGVPDGDMFRLEEVFHID